jgi:hypothetical protein
MRASCNCFHFLQTAILFSIYLIVLLNLNLILLPFLCLFFIFFQDTKSQFLFLLYNFLGLFYVLYLFQVFI